MHSSATDQAEVWDAGTSSGQWCSQNDQDGVAGRMQSVVMVLRFTMYTWEFVTFCSWSGFCLSCFCFVLLVLESWLQSSGLRGNHVLGKIQFYFALSSLRTGCLFFFQVGEGIVGKVLSHR